MTDAEATWRMAFFAAWFSGAVPSPDPYREAAPHERASWAARQATLAVESMERYVTPGGSS